jgi:hypothetical protein
MVDPRPTIRKTFQKHVNAVMKTAAANASALYLLAARSPPRLAAAGGCCIEPIGCRRSQRTR